MAGELCRSPLYYRYEKLILKVRCAYLAVCTANVNIYYMQVKLLATLLKRMKRNKYGVPKGIMLSMYIQQMLVEHLVPHQCFFFFLQMFYLL